MDRRPSPRPAFAKPTAIRYDEATLHLWGDEEAGFVEDRIYVSSEQIHQLELSLPPGGRFQHSDANRTIFAADEFFYVLEGTLVLANPATGEVQRARAGEGIFFRRDTWHHGYNYDPSNRLRVLELFAPPPAQGTSSSYARTKDNLTNWVYHDDTELTQWPMNEAQLESKRLFRVMREADVLWRLEDPDGDLLVGLYISTEHLTVGRGTLLPGRRGPVQLHDGDESVYVLEGRLNIFLPDSTETPSWYALGPGDGFYVPRGTTYQYQNVSAQQTTFLFAVAPSYLPVRAPGASRGSTT
jgi:quercetin dioxygenase-like cupin family protein